MPRLALPLALPLALSLALLSAPQLDASILQNEDGSAAPIEEQTSPYEREDAAEPGSEGLESLSTIPEEPDRAQHVPLEVLRASLRPLTKEQVEEELAAWLELLRRRCLEVREAEIAALESRSSAEVARFNQEAVKARAARGRLIERVRAVVTALEAKNGDVEDARAYLDSVVVVPTISGWRAAWTTARTWALSADGGGAMSLRLLRALGALALFWGLGRVAARLVGAALRSMGRASELLREFLVTSTAKVVLFLGLLVAANQMGLDMTPMLAAIGAAGLVLGLALQGTLSNFASGLLIMIYRPFDVGDVIKAGETLGTVEGMTLVSTLIRTFDNQSVIIPNNSVWGDVITNLTANSTRRVDLVFGIAYEDDVERAREVFIDEVKKHEKVLAEPAPMVEVSALSNSSVDFIVRPWVRTEDYWPVYWGLTREVKKRLDREGITIPFPQRDVHVHHHAGDGSEEDSLRPVRPSTEPPKEAGSAEPSASRTT